MSISSRTRWPPGRSVVRRCLIFASFLLSVSIFLLAKKTDINRSDNFVLHDSPQKIVTNIDAVRAILKSVFNIGLSFPPLSGLQSIRQAYQRPNKGFLEERWYFTLSNITYYSHSLPHLQELWPRADLPLIDRIENQLLFQPTRIIPVGQGNDTNGLKIIFVPNDVRSWFAEEGRGTFLKDKCPVDSCYLTNDRTMAKKSDAIIFKTASYNSKRTEYPESQLWILYLLESPLNTPSFSHSSFNKDSINWTATYRHDSDIVTPYGKFAAYNGAGMLDMANHTPPVDYAKRKRGKGKVAWFVSNCHAHNDRMDYAKELSQYIPVDIYGNCGDQKCSKDNGEVCMQMLQNDYKFYLAFENSNCRWYITEKLWEISFNWNLIPITMGAPLADYKAVAPPKSFIHVDEFAGPKQLAEYLTVLDQNETLYNEYFQWKNMGEIINTHFLCRVCAMLHSNYSKKHYDDIEGWWRAPGTCQIKR